MYAESIGKELGVYQDPYQYFAPLRASSGAPSALLDTAFTTRGGHGNRPWHSGGRELIRA